MNIRLQIEYDGTDFCGWQRQPGSPTIQALLEDILEKVLNKRTVVYGASRTDSGVHARGQVANFYSDADIPPERWAVLLNFYLPPTVRVQESREMPYAFHSQKYAVSKIYEYRVNNRGAASALDRRMLFYPKPLDWRKIEATLPHFVGNKDFKSFQAAGSTVLSSIRHVQSFELFEPEAGLYCLRIKGTGFLKQMVRNIVGTLLEVGEGKRDVWEIEPLLSSRDRRLAGRTAPAHGLCLMSVQYDG